MLAEVPLGTASEHVQTQPQVAQRMTPSAVLLGDVGQDLDDHLETH
ncbi:hypothetical protein [Herbidospora cretacea]|nr:hypothetical protein [Herbidospora cretacea]